MRCSRVATRCLSAGSWRKTADDFNQSRCGNRRIARDEGPGVNRVRNAGLRRGDDALAEVQVARDADLPGQHHVVVDDGAAGDADLRGKQDAPPDLDAVPDLHEVVDLGTGADAGLTNGRPIDRRIRADLDVVFDDDRRRAAESSNGCRRAA